MIQSYLAEKNVYAYESRQSERFKYIRRCVHSLLSEFQMCNGAAPTWRLYTKLYKDARNASTNNSETMYLADLKIGEVIYKCVFYKISSFWLISLNGFDFIILLRDSENDL